jgi:two-component system, OmpR family, sensor histidine kinase KdpD
MSSSRPPSSWLRSESGSAPPTLTAPPSSYTLSPVDSAGPKPKFSGNLAAGIEVLVSLALVTFFGKIGGLNLPTAGFLFLIAVLFVSSRRPLSFGAAAAVGATLCYNFFFFPPTHTFRVADPADWVALGAFLATSLLANGMLVRERQHAEEARASRREVEILYELSVDLLRAGGDAGRPAVAAGRALRAMGAKSGGVILFGASAQQQEVLEWIGDPPTPEVEDAAAGVARHQRATEIPSRFGRDVYLPLTLGGKTGGVLVVRGSPATRRALESLATLLSFAIEREMFVDERTRVAALRESNDLKTSLLQAISHDLHSPLTVLSVEIQALARRGGSHPDAAEHIGVVREEVAKLHRRIENLLSLARYEAGTATPRAEPTPAADLFRSARESLAAIVQSRPIRAEVAPDVPELFVDPSLALEIVVNLVENAHRASPPGEPIDLRAVVSSDAPERVWVEVLDRGPGFSPAQEKAIRRVGLPDAENRGIGIPLARTLAALSGGSLEWFPRLGGGTIARLDLPAAVIAREEVTP